MSQATDYLENKIVGHVFGAVEYTSPTTLYLGLYTSAPNDTGSGTEVSGSSYARQSVAFTITGGTASNTANVEFPKASSLWGDVGYFAISDAVSGGNMLCYGSLVESKTVESGDTLRFNAGELEITVS